MKPEELSAERSEKLIERLAASKFAARADEILNVVRGKEPLRFGSSVDVERASGRKAPNGEEYHVRIAASTEAIARDSGVIPITAWAKGGLKNFAKNPIILAFHDHKKPIGRSVHTELTSDKLIQYWEFHQESDDSRLMKTLYEKGFMRAASVGFLVHDWQFIDELSEKEYEVLEKKYGNAVKDIYWIARKAELLETSAVPVPSDPNALEFSFAARSAEAHGLDMSIFDPHRSIEMKDEKTPVAGQRNEAAAAPAQPATPAPAAGETVDVQKMIDAAIAGVRTEFEARFVAIEKQREGTASPATSGSESGASDEGSRGAEQMVQIEVLSGETREQAIERTVNEVTAKLAGAPQRKTK